MSEPEIDDRDESPQGVLMLSGDLMFASRVKSAAERAGKEFQLSGSIPDGVLESIRLVIVDLSTRSGLLPDITTQCTERCPNARLIAYGPHVQVDKLSAARQAGIETVLTNGQFDRGLSSLF